MMDLMDKLGASLEGLGRRLRGMPRQVQQIALPKLRLGQTKELSQHAIAPDLLHRGAVVYSLGIGASIDFELELIGRFGCTVHAFDPAPNTQAFVRTLQLPPQFIAHAWGVSDRDGLLQVDGARARTSWGEVRVRRLTTLMDQLGHGHLDLLKLDIAGAEYAVIDTLASSSIRPTQVLVEFHHHKRHIPLARTERALTQLNRLGYRIFDCQPDGKSFSLALV